MRVTVLGSGTSVPNMDRFPAGYLVEADGKSILIDLGPGVLRRAAACGLDLDTIDAVLLTHFHTDHCADLAMLAFGMINPRYHERTPLPILAHEGLLDLFGGITQAWPWAGKRSDLLDLKEIGPGEHEVVGVRFEAIRIEHTVESLGYRITDSGGRVAAFSGDAVFCDALTPLGKDADLFICDAAFPNAVPGIGHMTAGECGEAARRAGAKHLVPTHFYPECEGHDIYAEAVEASGTKVTLAQDLLCFDLVTGEMSQR